MEMIKYKVVLYIAMSLDGYIARKDGSVDWLNDVKGDGADNGYDAFYKNIEVVIMGRNTYEEVLHLSEEFPYKGKKCIVLTQSKKMTNPHVIFTNEDIENLVSHLKAQANGDIWLVGGGELVKSFMEKGLIEELQIAVIPKLLGDGISLFPKGIIPSTFSLQETEKMGDIISLKYKV
ncbi:dihydrofolate reductase family protein [Rossellomorea sp. BNER]|uniref:dihydrofolate reductase family protein n=1 Tax=Rossellomorea sp. BNER TaxID=2962031 RepID=UPI003AF28CAB|nr:dihydrofolate reductase family protein [Rossellomorea sp. BNER]